MDRPRQIVNTQYAVNVDVIDSAVLRDLNPEVGALVVTTEGYFYFGDGSQWNRILFE